MANTEGRSRSSSPYDSVPRERFTLMSIRHLPYTKVTCYIVSHERQKYY